MNRRYDIRPRLGPGRPPKSPTKNEPQIKYAKTKTIIIQPLSQIVETSQIDKIILTAFNVERELERVKMPIPLAKL